MSMKKSARDKATSSLAHLSCEKLVFYPRNASERSYAADLEGRGPGFLRYTNVEDLLASFFLGASVGNQKKLNWRDMCIGISSESVNPNGLERGHVPFLDYDGKHIKTTIRQDVKRLQEKYGVGPASVYRTKRGAHVYFLHDTLPEERLSSFIEDSNCCPGFKSASQRRRFAVLRVSAKYTEFDIALDQVIPAIDNELRRKTRKGHLIESLLALGTASGTHFASLFPQWAHYREDQRPWKAQGKRAPHERGKFIIKRVEVADAPAPIAQEKVQWPGVFLDKLQRALGEDASPAQAPSYTLPEITADWYSTGGTFFNNNVGTFTKVAAEDPDAFHKNQVLKYVVNSDGAPKMLKIDED